jgi:hypothetical protein
MQQDSDFVGPNVVVQRSSAKPSSRLRQLGFVAVNAWLIFHCIAIFLPPFSVPPAPRSVQDAYARIQFYPQFMFLDHGYHFFGPDPGDSTLLKFVATEENRVVGRGTIPSKQIFPRLLYHRHFMLTESIPRIEETDRRLFDLQQRTYAAQLRRQWNADSVQLDRVTHRLIPVERFLAGVPLDDPDSYERDSWGNFPSIPAENPSQKP